MCSNPSSRKLTIRPDFDMDVYLHPPSMHHHNRIRRISTSFIDSADGNGSKGSPTTRRFSISNIFSYFRQNSSTEFPTFNNGTIETQTKAEEKNMTASVTVKEEKMKEVVHLFNKSFSDDDDF